MSEQDSMITTNEAERERASAGGNSQATTALGRVIDGWNQRAIAAESELDTLRAENARLAAEVARLNGVVSAILKQLGARDFDVETEDAPAWMHGYSQHVPALRWLNGSGGDVDALAWRKEWDTLANAEQMHSDGLVTIADEYGKCRIRISAAGRMLLDGVDPSLAELLPALRALVKADGVIDSEAWFKAHLGKWIVDELVEAGFATVTNPAGEFVAYTAITDAGREFLAKWT